EPAHEPAERSIGERKRLVRELHRERLRTVGIHDCNHRRRACTDDEGLTATQRNAARAVRLLHDLYGYEARELVDLRIARIDEARRVEARALRVRDLLVELGDLACERIDLSYGRQALLRDRSALTR